MIAGIAIWAGLCVIATALLVAASRRIGRLRAAAWMITIAAVLLVEEDPGLLLWMASVGPSTDSGGVLSLVSAHTRAHMYGGAAWSAAAIFGSVVVAHGWLAAADRRAWLLLLGVLLIGGAGDLYALTVFPHGLPLLPTPAGGDLGFGWPTLVAGLAIWALALAFSWGPVFVSGNASPTPIKK